MKIDTEAPFKVLMMYLYGLAVSGVNNVSLDILNTLQEAGKEYEQFNDFLQKWVGINDLDIVIAETQPEAEKTKIPAFSQSELQSVFNDLGLNDPNLFFKKPIWVGEEADKHPHIDRYLALLAHIRPETKIDAYYYELRRKLKDFFKNEDYWLNPDVFVACVKKRGWVDDNDPIWRSVERMRDDTNIQLLAEIYEQPPWKTRKSFYGSTLVFSTYVTYQIHEANPGLHGWDYNSCPATNAFGAQLRRNLEDGLFPEEFLSAYIRRSAEYIENTAMWQDFDKLKTDWAKERVGPFDGWAHNDFLAGFAGNATFHLGVDVCNYFGYSREQREIIKQIMTSEMTRFFIQNRDNNFTPVPNGFREIPTAQPA